jgi:hypothetical protein
MAAKQYGFVNGKWQVIPQDGRRILAGTPTAGSAVDDYSPGVAGRVTSTPVVPVQHYNNDLRRAVSNDWVRSASTGAPTTGGQTAYTGASTSAPRASVAAAPAAPQPKIYTSDELAKMYGINYDYDYILNLLNQGSAKKRDEVLGQIDRDRANSLRSGQGMFGQYLDALRQTKSNAVATGVNKGTLAAQELMAMLGTQDKLSQEQLMMNQLSQKTFDEYATNASMNQSLAFTNSNAIKQYLGTLSSNLNANDVQRYAAELAAKAAAGGSSGGGYSYSGGGGSGYTNPDVEYAKYLLTLNPIDRYKITNK